MMLVPTNEAMQEYWTSEEGKFLADKFPQWDSVYTKVISAFCRITNNVRSAVHYRTIGTSWLIMRVMSWALPKMTYVKNHTGKQRIDLW